MNARLRRLVALTVPLTGFLMVLGVYTAAAGAGLTCAGRWPFCDGFLGLFPANWSSFIEWFHRLVAMLVGFLILGTTIQTWRTGADRRVRRALAVATVLLPSQIILGALTVTTYEWLILSAHFITASTIFTGVVLAAAWSFETPAVAEIQRMMGVLAAGVVALVVLSPHMFVSFGANVQAIYYTLGLVVYGSLVAATVWLGATDADNLDRVRLATGGAALILVSLLVLGRQVYGGTLQYVSVGGTVVAFGLVAAAAYTLRSRSVQQSRSIPGGSD
ncbi:heme A synthase [Halogeometricum borinquense]|uniref:Heme A synthase n=1 Tax=Halogeometricum borinquense TaxID=60847 RepID=A0A6C0UI68_9EURY|nr:COX15/CtaA family protein [Halogeometricum borinquense]QIB75202.1 heme A synthase [Halogeometricum borinquense]QIQ75823.1 heme A synthase [Halogeometricum borinquense]